MRPDMAIKMDHVSHESHESLVLLASPGLGHHGGIKFQHWGSRADGAFRAAWPSSVETTGGRCFLRRNVVDSFNL